MNMQIRCLGIRKSGKQIPLYLCWFWLVDVSTRILEVIMVAIDFVQVAATQISLSLWIIQYTTRGLQLYQANLYSTYKRKKILILISCYCYLSNSNTKYTRQITWLQCRPQRFCLRFPYTRLKKKKRAKVIGGCKHPCSTPQPHSFFWKWLLHPCHSSDPWIYDGCVVCCTHCGPAPDPCPGNGAGSLCVCGHCSHGPRLGDCGHDVGGHSGLCVHGNNLPLALRRQSLGSPGFLNQTSLAWRGLGWCHCGGCGVGLRRKTDAGISSLVPGKILQPGKQNGQEPNDLSSAHLENSGGKRNIHINPDPCK